MENDVCGHQENSGYQPGTELNRHWVEAADGHIGKVDKRSADVGTECIVADTGPWIFGKQVLPPAGTIVAVDTDDQCVRDRTHQGRDQGLPRVRRRQAHRRQ